MDKRKLEKRKRKKKLEHVRIIKPPIDLKETDELKADCMTHHKAD